MGRSRSGAAALAFALSWGRLGADVGAVLLAVVAGAAVARSCSAGAGRAPARSRSCSSPPIAGLAALALLDLATGGDAHFTRSVLRAGGLDELADVAQRRVELSYRSLGAGDRSSPGRAGRGRARGRGPLPQERLLASTGARAGSGAAVWGGFVAVVVGALSNDSGPIILLIGTSYLALAVGYLRRSAEPGAHGPLR